MSIYIVLAIVIISWILLSAFLLVAISALSARLSRDEREIIVSPQPKQKPAPARKPVRPQPTG